MHEITTQHIADLKANPNSILVIAPSRLGWEASVTDDPTDGLRIIVTLGTWVEDKDGLCIRMETPITGAMVADAPQTVNSLIRTFRLSAELAWTRWDTGALALAQELAEDPTTITNHVI